MGWVNSISTLFSLGQSKKDLSLLSQESTLSRRHEENKATLPYFAFDGGRSEDDRGKAERGRWSRFLRRSESKAHAVWDLLPSKGTKMSVENAHFVEDREAACPKVQGKKLEDTPRVSVNAKATNMKRSLNSWTSSHKYIDNCITRVDTVQELPEDIDENEIEHFPSISCKNDTRALHRSMSLPGIAHDLSHKFSAKFGNPTIIRRPSLKVRPSIGSITGYAIQLDNSASPSSYLTSRSISVAEISTPKTSFGTNFGVTRSISQASERIPTPALTVIEDFVEYEDETDRRTSTPPKTLSVVVIKPSIRTVETTANAKIFFETYFNSLLSEKDTSRDVRRQDLEGWLDSQDLTSEKREAHRLLWGLKESEHLRRSRALKSQSRRLSARTGIAVAGFEVIRVLGKGSFGVVRLVRETSNEKRADDFDGSGSSSMSTSKFNPLRNLRSSLEGRKASSVPTQRSTVREVYAMKVIRKSGMIRSAQEGHLRAERDFLVASEKSRWVVPLIASFQDSANLYLVMEYMIGGDFLGLLIKKDRLSEKKTQFYLAEMILCVEEAHRLKWIHRDVKPDNFLISASGHLKISDFGLAFDGHWAHDQNYFHCHRYSLLQKLGINVGGDEHDQEEIEKANADGKVDIGLFLGHRERRAMDRHHKPSNSDPTQDQCVLEWRNRHGRRKLAKSMVGTSQYMAPEVIRGEQYDGRCDWWSIGIILYECLFGWTPFLGADRDETKMKILDHGNQLELAPWRHGQSTTRISKDAKDLIKRLLQDKEGRLCGPKYKRNDFEQYRLKGQGRSSSEPGTYQDFLGHFVFPDDASDIKRHTFFNGIDWENLHSTKPPEVPKVRDRADTRYFDQEPPVSDLGESSNSYVPEEEMLAQEDFEHHIKEVWEQENLRLQQLQEEQDDLELYEKSLSEVGLLQAAYEDYKESFLRARRRDKRRPRDRILRDSCVAKEALELRKQGAFAGYTYRRPRTILSEILCNNREKEGKYRRPGFPNFSSLVSYQRGESQG